MAIKENKWEDYEYRGYYMFASAEDLRRIVRRAAKAANQRLLRRERAGRTKGVYAGIMAELGRLDRKRFIESKKRLDEMSINELRHEYVMLRDWLSAKTSTVQGLRAADDKRYQTAMERGFTGTLDEWNQIAETFFTAEREKFFDSNATYMQVTAGNADIVQKIIERTQKKSEETSDKGALLVRLVKAAAGRNKAAAARNKTRR